MLRAASVRVARASAVRHASTSASAGTASSRRMALAAAGAAAAAASVALLARQDPVAHAEYVWYNPLSWFSATGGTSGVSPEKARVSTGKVDYDKLRSDIEDLVLDKECGPLLLRLAWHASGTYDAKTNTGGSNGATMRYALEAGDGANAGLDLARNLLEPIKDKHPGITYADLWTFAGKVAVEYMGGADIKWLPGRTDAPTVDSCPPNGRLPDAAQGPQHLRDVFYRMGFNDQEIVALSGAHTLGRCHTDRSGFDGPWSRDPNGFDNDYFRLLLEEKWTVRKNFKPTQYQDSTGELMMLPTDMALVWDAKFRPWVEKYAKDQDLWQADFSKAFARLIENGVPR